MLELYILSCLDNLNLWKLVYVGYKKLKWYMDMYDVRSDIIICF